MLNEIQKRVLRIDKTYVKKLDVSHSNILKNEETKTQPISFSENVIEEAKPKKTNKKKKEDLENDNVVEEDIESNE